MKLYEIEDIVKFISNKELREFTEKVLEKEEINSFDAMMVSSILIETLLKNKIMRVNEMDGKMLPDLNTDVSIMSALFHNLGFGYRDKDPSKIFNARTKLNALNDSKLLEPYIDMIAQNIESQLGKDSANKLLIPTLGSPGFYLAEACHIYYGIMMAENLSTITDCKTGKVVARVPRMFIELYANLLNEDYMYGDE